MNHILDETKMNKYESFDQSKQWEEFLEENPLLQVDLTNPFPPINLVEGESYVFIVTYDESVHIYKVIFLNAEWKDGYADYTFENEPGGYEFSLEESHLIQDVLLYPYTEEVPCK